MHETFVMIISVPLAVLFALLLMHKIEARRQKRDPRHWRKW